MGHLKTLEVRRGDIAAKVRIPIRAPHRPTSKLRTRRTHGIPPRWLRRVAMRPGGAVSSTRGTKGRQRLRQNPLLVLLDTMRRTHPTHPRSRSARLQCTASVDLGMRPTKAAWLWLLVECWASCRPSSQRSGCSPLMWFWCTFMSARWSGALPPHTCTRLIAAYRPILRCSMRRMSSCLERAHPRGCASKRRSLDRCSSTAASLRVSHAACMCRAYRTGCTAPSPAQSKQRLADRMRRGRPPPTSVRTRSRS